MKKQILITSILFYLIPTYTTQYTEKTILELVKQFIPANPVIVEAGAHLGEDTEKMSNLWPEGIIHAFEPLPASFKTLQQGVKKCSYVFCYHYALNNMSGRVPFYVSSNNEGASSLLKPTSIIHHLAFKEAINVPCITLDEWAEQNNIDYIDFMWLDMEGNELPMLKAAPKIIKTVKAIYTEVNLLEFRSGTPLYHEVKTWLEQQGFIEIWKYFPSKQGNILFVRT